jgi:hypothetical protein
MLIRSRNWKKEKQYNGQKDEHLVNFLSFKEHFWRYQRGIQNSKKDTQYDGQKKWLNDKQWVNVLTFTHFFEDTKGVIKSRYSTKDRQYNGEKKWLKDKQWSSKHNTEN